jgi:hypothetical protein
MVLFDINGFDGMVQEDAESISKEERIYSCVRCGSMITAVRKEITVEGRFKHSFTNPHGYMFTIGCFSDAPGCVAAGPSTGEFTWFPGYAWRICVCTACGMHLGWKFSKDTSGFFGLILNNLSEGSGGG